MTKEIRDNELKKNYMAIVTDRYRYIENNFLWRTGPHNYGDWEVTQSEARKASGVL